MDLLGELGVVLAAATIGGAVFERAGVSAIPAFLVAGAIVGPGGLGLAGDRGEIGAAAELGVVFLLFEIGLELPVETVRRLWRDALVIGGLQVVATTAAVAAIATGFGISLPTGLAFGGLVAMSSTAVVMRSLVARRQVDAPQGRIALAILLFQDLCIVPLLLGVPILAGVVEPSFAAIGGAVATTIAALAILFGVARFVFPWLLDRVAVLRSSELFSLVAFLLVIGSALGAERLGLTHAVGAFSAGLVLAASPYAHQLQAEVAPLRGVLLGVFFTSIGMLFDPAAAVRLAPAIGVYVAAVVLLKAGLIALVIAATGAHGVRFALAVGLALAQTGEFSFVLGEEVRRAGLLDDELWQVFLAGSIATLAATPLLIGWAPRLLARAGPGSAGPPPPALREHVVIAGFGHTGRTIARILRGAGIPYLVVDVNARAVTEARARGEPIVYGDVTQPRILEALGLREARVLAIAISDPVAARRVLTLGRDLAPSLRLIVRARYIAEVDDLYARGASIVVADEYESALDLLTAVLRSVGITKEAADKLADELRDEGYEALRAPASLALDPWLAEILREESSQWVTVPEGPAAGRSLRALAIRQRTGVTVLALRRGEQTWAGPSPDWPLEAGDQLLVVARADAVQRLARLLADDSAAAAAP